MSSSLQIKHIKFLTQNIKYHKSIDGSTVTQQRSQQVGRLSNTIAIERQLMVDFVFNFKIMIIVYTIIVIKYVLREAIFFDELIKFCRTTAFVRKESAFCSQANKIRLTNEMNWNMI